MLLRVDVDKLVAAVFQALDLAAQGEVAEGYQALLMGRQRALEGEANLERVPSSTSPSTARTGSRCSTECARSAANCPALLEAAEQWGHQSSIRFAHRFRYG